MYCTCLILALYSGVDKIYKLYDYLTQNNSNDMGKMFQVI